MAARTATRPDQVAKRRTYLEGRISAGQTWREKSMHYANWVKACLDGVPATPDGAARREAVGAVLDAIEALEVLERDSVRAQELVGGAR